MSPYFAVSLAPSTRTSVQELSLSLHNSNAAWWVVTRVVVVLFKTRAREDDREAVDGFLEDGCGKLHVFGCDHDFLDGTTSTAWGDCDEDEFQVLFKLWCWTSTGLSPEFACTERKSNL